MRPTYVATAVAYVFPAHMCLTSVSAHATLKRLCDYVLGVCHKKGSKVKQ